MELERIRQLFAQQLAEPNEDVSSPTSSWTRYGTSWAGMRRTTVVLGLTLIRLHSGTFPHFPCELDIVGVMKRLPGVKDAQLTLVDFAQNEVARFMRANARTIRLSGTAFSRALEF